MRLSHFAVGNSGKVLLPPSSEGCYAGADFVGGIALMHDTFGDNQWLVGVAGESHSNDDGSSRQQIIANCSVGEPITLVREPDNKFDADAVKVCRASGEQVGYLPRDSAQRLQYELQNNWPISAEIYSLHGGTAGKPIHGVVLKLTRETKVFTATASMPSSDPSAAPLTPERASFSFGKAVAIIAAVLLMVGIVQMTRHNNAERGAAITAQQRRIASIPVAAAHTAPVKTRAHAIVPRNRFEGCRAKLKKAQELDLLYNMDWNGQSEPTVLVGPTFFTIPVDAKEGFADTVNCFLVAGSDKYINFDLRDWRTGNPVARYSYGHLKVL